LAKRTYGVSRLTPHRARPVQDGPFVYPAGLDETVSSICPAEARQWREAARALANHSKLAVCASLPVSAVTDLADRPGHDAQRSMT